MKTALIIYCYLVLFTEPLAIPECNPYFKFDSIDHLKYEKSFSYDNLRKVNKTPADLTLEEILIKDTSNSLSDTLVIKKAEQCGFNKKQLSENQFNNINKIFCSKDYDASQTTFCDPIYNDILIFRSKGKIIGFSKICLGCDKIIIIGKDIHVKKVLERDDYIALKQILN